MVKEFPEPISLPGAVPKARKERYRALIRASIYGILLRLVIILAEFSGYIIFNSSSLFLDAVSSLTDVISTIVLIVCIKLAERPPDEDHPFGHGRYEPLAGLQLGVLLVLFGGIMLFQQVVQLFNTNVANTIDPYTWIIPFCAVIILEICYQIVSYTAKKRHSAALSAEAWHYRMDALNSLFATVALMFAASMPSWSVAFDHFGAILIAVLMIGVGFFASRKNVHQLMDRIPSPEFFKKVREAAMSVRGVKETEKTRIQLYGPDAHVDIDIEVDPLLAVERAHKISQKVRVEIQKAWPAVRDVTVHIEPFYPGDH